MWLFQARLILSEVNMFRLEGFEFGFDFVFGLGLGLILVLVMFFGFDVG